MMMILAQETITLVLSDNTKLALAKILQGVLVHSCFYIIWKITTPRR